MNKILIPISEACQMLSMSRSFFYQMVSSGRLPGPLKFGRKSLWSVESLRAFVQKELKKQ